MKLTEDSKNAIIMSESHIVARRLRVSANKHSAFTTELVWSKILPNGKSGGGRDRP